MRDQEMRFSQEQAITADAASTDCIDVGPLQTGNAHRQLGAPGVAALGVLMTVTTTFDTAAEDGTLDVSFQTDADEAFGSATTLFAFAQIAEAALVEGAKFFLPLPPKNYEEFNRLYYNVGGAGNFTAGKMTAELCFYPGDWYAYADNQPPGGY